MHNGLCHDLERKYIILKNEDQGTFGGLYPFMHKVVYIWLFALLKEKL